MKSEWPTFILIIASRRWLDAIFRQFAVDLGDSIRPVHLDGFGAR